MRALSFNRHRFPPEVIRYAVWLYFGFTLSVREVEERRAQCEIEVSYETIRCWTRWFARAAGADCIWGALSMTRTRFSTS